MSGHPPEGKSHEGGKKGLWFHAIEFLEEMPNGMLESTGVDKIAGEPLDAILDFVDKSAPGKSGGHGGGGHGHGGGGGHGH